MTTCFFTLLALILYVYCGYPLLLAIRVPGRRKPARHAAVEPSVSVIIPAHNEESGIAAKLRSVQEVKYPSEKIEILVGSDGSTDATCDVVRAFGDPRIRFFEFRQQRGKSTVQSELVAMATGDVLVFTDADCPLPATALQRLVAPLADERVGLVTAQPLYCNSKETEVARNESLYWRYERWIRKQESERGLLTTASGHLFCLRRVLWDGLDANVGDDFVLPLKMVLRGYRNVDAGVLVISRLSQVRSRTMFRMKMRIISKDLRGLFSNRGALNPRRFGAIALALWSHKLLRWLVPYMLIGLLACNLALLDRPAFTILFALQIVFYLMAAGAWLRGEDKLGAPWSVLLSFCLVNAAALAGTLHCISGKTTGRWTPVR